MTYGIIPFGQIEPSVKPRLLLVSCVETSEPITTFPFTRGSTNISPMSFDVVVCFKSMFSEQKQCIEIKQAENEKKLDIYSQTIVLVFTSKLSQRHCH